MNDGWSVEEVEEEDGALWWWFLRIVHVANKGKWFLYRISSHKDCPHGVL